MAGKLNREQAPLASNGSNSPKGSVLIEVRNLKTHFYAEGGVVPAVDGVSFSIDRGETLGLVGESGCGKSVTSLSIIRLIPIPPGRFLDGEILFEDKDLLKMNKEEIRSIRGNRISMIFQEPMTSLNPVFTVGDQIMESFLLHQRLNRSDAKTRTIEMLRIVGIPAPEKRVNDYPHQMSGGMRQRVMIAMALSCNPKLLIADEPTTALDVTIQAQILKLMKRLKNEMGMSIMLITHDLGMVADIANKVYVMYAGKIVESADTLNIFKKPRHHYTIGLLGSIPKLNEDRERLQVIEGNVPNPFRMPPGCRFHPRCSKVMEVCKSEEPELLDLEGGHRVSCWLYQQRSFSEDQRRPEEES
jgi:oligopeptide/dipeptide ABC transporter ATP-binding protein